MTKGYFTDIHCHGLFGVDDGARTLEESLRLIEMARKQNIRRLIFTFHYSSRADDADGDDIDDAEGDKADEVISEAGNITAEEKSEQLVPRAMANFDILKAEALSLYPDMELYIGSEVYYDSSVVEKIADGRVPTLAGTHFVLIEPEYLSMPDRIFSIANEIVMAGYKPILAHTERYEKLTASPAELDRLINLGTCIQVNSRTFTRGRFSRTGKWAMEMMRAGKVHFIADDYHNPDDRSPLMKTIYDQLAAKVDNKTINRVFFDNPEILFEDGTITAVM